MNFKLLRRIGLMGMELGREGQLQVNNCHEYYCSAWSKLNSEIGLNTHPPTAMEVDRLCNLGNLSSRGWRGGW
jgi:hypothetical protein